MDEDAVNITRHKHILEDIRNGGQDDGRTGVGIGHVESSHDFARPDEGSADQNGRAGQRSIEGTIEGSGTPQGLHTGTRQAQPKDVNATKGARKRRRTVEAVTEEKPAPTRLRLPFLEKSQTKKTPVKLFSIEEAEAEQERMAEIYSKLFAFGDDILEIIVRDHEPVEIWQITNEQADTLARNHLNQARTNVEAARSARKLLEIYDRLYFYSVMIPRVVKTSNHIAEHKGVSFK